MRDFKAYVRARLMPSGLSAEEEIKIIDELAGQLEELYQSLLDRGVSAHDAWVRVEREVPDWERLRADLIAAIPEFQEGGSPAGKDSAIASSNAASCFRSGCGEARGVNGTSPDIGDDLVSRTAVCIWTISSGIHGKGAHWLRASYGPPHIGLKSTFACGWPVSRRTPAFHSAMPLELPRSDGDKSGGLRSKNKPFHRQRETFFSIRRRHKGCRALNLRTGVTHGDAHSPTLEHQHVVQHVPNGHDFWSGNGQQRRQSADVPSTSATTRRTVLRTTWWFWPFWIGPMTSGRVSSLS